MNRRIDLHHGQGQCLRGMLALIDQFTQDVRTYAETLHFSYHVKRTEKNLALVRAGLHPADIASISHNDAGVLKLEPFGENLLLAALIPTEHGLNHCAHRLEIERTGEIH